MSPRLRAALYAHAGAVFSLHPCLYAGDRPTAGRSRFATLLPGDAAVSPSNGDHAGTQRADPPPPRNGPKHRGAGRSRSATGPPRQSRSTRQFFCAEVLVLLRGLRRDYARQRSGLPVIVDGDKGKFGVSDPDPLPLPLAKNPDFETKGYGSPPNALDLRIAAHCVADVDWV